MSQASDHGACATTEDALFIDFSGSSGNPIVLDEDVVDDDRSLQERTQNDVQILGWTSSILGGTFQKEVCSISLFQFFTLF